MFAHRRKAATDGYIAFLERFSVWWNGDEPLDLAQSNDPADKSAITVSSSEPDKHWPQQRLAICERLWGEAMSHAGGIAAMEEFIKPLCIDSSMSVMDLTAGLGGGPALISKKSNIWIAAMESDPELFALATEYCTRKGAARASITAWQPSKPALPTKKYHCIYGREAFFLVEDKKALLAAIVEALKPGGQFLFSDYVLADKGEERTALQAWRGYEPGDPSLWSVADYRAALKECGLKIRICSDDTDAQRRLILGGWTNLVEGLKRSDLTTDFVDHMMREATLWLARMRALDDGQLQVARIHAFKPNEIV